MVATAEAGEACGEKGRDVSGISRIYQGKAWISVSAPAIADVTANVKPGPIVDRSHGWRCFGVWAGSQIRSLGAGGGAECDRRSNQNTLHFNVPNASDLDVSV